jgi:outer membrane protein assembly factor BamB
MSNCASGKRWIVWAFVGVVAAAGALASAGAADWPIYRGPTCDGISAETGWVTPQAELKVAWTVELGKGCSAMSVVGDRVYTMGNDGSKDTVYCLDAATGKEVWKFTYECPLAPQMYEGGPNATPTVDGGKVYTCSKKGQVYCFDAAKGDMVWQAQLKAKAPTWGYSGSILPVGEMVILNAGPAGTALNKADGKVVWESGDAAGGYSTPVPVKKGDATLVVLFSAKTTVAVAAADGKKAWEFPWVTSYDVNAADPVVIDGGAKVFVSSGYNKGCALMDVSGEAPKELWSNKKMRNKHTNSVFFKGAFYGFDESTATCLDAATGEAKWTQNGFGEGSLMLADGKLIILAQSGKLIIADAAPDAFKEVASGQAVKGPCWTMPVLAGGKIYCRSKPGSLSCSSFGGK